MDKKQLSLLIFNVNTLNYQPKYSLKEVLGTSTTFKNKYSKKAMIDAIYNYEINLCDDEMITFDLDDYEQARQDYKDASDDYEQARQDYKDASDDFNIADSNYNNQLS